MTEDYVVNNRGDLTPLFHYGPVTCIKFYLNFILVGYGPILKIFKVEGNSSSLIATRKVFRKNKIHCITTDKESENVALSGGRSFIVFNLNKFIDENIKLEEKAINEWITSIKFSGRDRLLILNSHNTVYQIDISSLDRKYVLIEKTDCKEKSILYSGSFTIRPSGEVLVAAGTVMNGVIIWSLQTRKIIHNLTEHEGSVFGVKINPTGEYIISCSDDRSIKLYDFKTGTLLATGWGHNSRIWSLQFFNNTSELKILSTGEDCSVRTWKYKKGSELLIQEKLMEHAHMGKHIWSGDVDDISVNAIVSGGSDGKVRLHDLAQTAQSECFSLETLSRQTGVNLKKNEIIKNFYELRKLNLLVLLTSAGNMFTFDHRYKEFKSIVLNEGEVEIFDNFGIMRGFDDMNLVLICSRQGHILVLQFNSASEQPLKEWVSDELLGTNKVSNFSSYHNDNSIYYYTLTDCPNPKVPLQLKRFKYVNGIFTLDSNNQLLQPSQANFTTTCFVVDEEHKWALIGSRYVSLAIYDLARSSSTYSLSALFKKLTPGDSITSISFVSPKQNCDRILVTVKDGYYLYADVGKIENDFFLDITHQNKFPRGFVEGSFMESNDLYLYGFRSTYFYVWNESKQLEIFSEYCGGSHRQWQFFENCKHDGSYKFIFINKSSLYINRLKTRFRYDGLLEDGTHGREIRDVTISPSVLEDGSRLMMSASEDTTVKLNKLFSDGRIENIWSLNDHVSGLQKIKFLNSMYVGSSAANEEFYIWKLNLDKFQTVHITKFAVLKAGSSIPDLRIMDFDYFEIQQGFMIAAVYSNSNIKIWNFNLKTRVFECLVDDYYTSCCILNVRFLKFQTSTFLMIGATDGNIAIWNISKSIMDNDVSKLGHVQVKQNLHQNSIKSLLIVKQSDSESLRLVTGGDDNALILSLISFDDNHIKLRPLSFIEKAASSTITSIAQATDSRVLVTSVDQILRVWSYSNDLLQCNDATYTTIADTGCSDTTNFGDSCVAIVGGAGLSSWKIQ
ncbi:uncharacterized protein PRCAT00003276001 [Priceomyces carsonii]|uniref:uncharacterized protein n=1 Tax=Priceomyces carsonii TaxID=28549 RepID=UPI002ED9822E|nr:unnamed protein product [Priceomyces carsonii]